MCQDVGAFSSTVVETPFHKTSFDFPNLRIDMTDTRIGQIKYLNHPQAGENLDEKLLNSLHQKTRNIVRKGMKGDFIVSHGISREIISELHKIHKENILAVNGIPKPRVVFEAIAEIFDYERDFRIYFAKKGDEIISALLVFYFKDTVEYFCPVIKKAFRKEQPLSLLIFTAMRDAMTERGSTIWNWGGTWQSQESVYKFKARWGSEDFPYKYYITIKSGFDISSLQKAKLLNEYKFFYTVPFGKLN